MQIAREGAIRKVSCDDFRTEKNQGPNRTSLYYELLSAIVGARRRTRAFLL